MFFGKKYKFTYLKVPYLKVPYIPCVCRRVDHFTLKGPCLKGPYAPASVCIFAYPSCPHTPYMPILPYFCVCVAPPMPVFTYVNERKDP